jgi:ribosomal-protein-alanine N-acetyltransferase
VEIRPGTLEDIPAMIALDHASPAAAHWTDRQYLDLFTSGRLILVAFSATANSNPKTESPETKYLKAFLVARRIDYEWELENIVVLPSAQRQGIGKALLHAFIEAASEPDSQAVFLEVRESNWAARALYESAGFELTGQRKSYYSEPLEDAVLYRRNLH